MLTDRAINPTTVLRRKLTLRGIYVGSRQMFEAMNRAIELHSIHPVIDWVFGFNHAKNAYCHLQSQAHVGKVASASSEHGAACHPMPLRHGKTDLA